MPKEFIKLFQYTVWENKYTYYDPDRPQFKIPRAMTYYHSFGDTINNLETRLLTKVSDLESHGWSISKIDLRYIGPSNKIPEIYRNSNLYISKFDDLDDDERAIGENLTLDQVRQWIFEDVSVQHLPINLEIRMMLIDQSKFNRIMVPISYSISKMDPV